MLLLGTNLYKLLYDLPWDSCASLFSVLIFPPSVSWLLGSCSIFASYLLWQNEDSEGQTDGKDTTTNSWYFVNVNDFKQHDSTFV